MMYYELFVVPLTSSKVLSLEKTKKMRFFLVFCSLIRTFAPAFRKNRSI